MKRELIAMIDESSDAELKSRFYSNETVAAIMNKLYERWELAGGIGIPLDYASNEEIRELYEIARRLFTSSERGTSDLLKKVFGG